jgi:trk system potassium uptake protein
MQFTAVCRIIGLLLLIFSLSLLPPILVGFIYHDGAIKAFIFSALFTAGMGICLWMPFRHRKHELKTRDGFWVVSLFWFVLSLFAAIPLMLAANVHETLTDAMFETVSGFTTTGATILVGIDKLPHAILYYRQQLQFLGGMGIIVLAVAILPMLGIGGMQLYKAETPGPVKDNKLTPRITETAKTLWYIYVGIVVLCTLAFWAAGMDFFDALGHSFATISTGGFSTHDASLGYFHSNLLYVIATFFMIAGSINFSLHFISVQKGGVKHYWQDTEFKFYIYFLLVTILITTAMLLIYRVYTHPGEAFIQSMFNIVSLSTTTGFVSTNFDLWPTFVPIMIMIIAMIGGCAGSTSGGIKIVRILLLYKQGSSELERLIHPKAVLALKFGDTVLTEGVIQAIWGFIALFMVVFIFFVLAMMATGLDLRTAFSAVAACISNAGPGLGAVTANFKNVSDVGKWILIFTMLTGRLEVFTLLVLFSPSFWRL